MADHDLGQSVESTLMVRRACRMRQENLFKSGQETDSRVVNELIKIGMWSANEQRQNLAEIQKEIVFPTIITFEGGIAQIRNNPDLENALAQCQFLGYDEYVSQIRTINKYRKNGKLEGVCQNRLLDLQLKYKSFCFEYAAYEAEVIDRVYQAKEFVLNKVDTHLHGGAASSQPMLVRYLRRQMREIPNEIVSIRNGVPMKLIDIFREVGIERAEDLTQATLNMNLGVDENNHIPISFDVFNSRFNPCQKIELKLYFLKIDNLNEGRHFASILMEAGDVAETRKEILEVRLTLMGSHPEELKTLANWAVLNNIFHSHIRYLIQIPTSFYKMQSRHVNTFQDFLRNIFTIALYASYNPQDLPNVAIFLEHVVGIDLVDDEGEEEFQVTDVDYATPEHFGAGSRLPYNYFLYYIYRNLCVLNRVRKYCVENNKNKIVTCQKEERALLMKPFHFRPHSGEAGSVEHLVGAFLLAHNVNHGRMLKEAGGILTYLYYINQIGLSFSLISNFCLYERYELTPFKRFLEMGLRVALTTDDRTIFHQTEDPLSEEFEMAKNRLGISNPEITELCRNSVLISGLSYQEKERLLGPNFQMDDFEGNDENITSVPTIRIRIRAQSLNQELAFVFSGDVGRF